MKVKRKEKVKCKKTKRAALFTAFFVTAGVVIIFAIPILAYDSVYKNKVYVGVSIGGVPIGNLSFDDAEKKIERLVNAFDRDGFQFSAKGKTVAITPTVTAIGDIDLSYDLLTIDVDNMVEAAFSYGRSGGLVRDTVDQIQAIFAGKDIPLQYNINRDKFIEALQENFAKLEDPSEPPKIAFVGDEIIVTEEVVGKTFNYEKAVDDLEVNLDLYNEFSVVLEEKDFEPTIKKQDILKNIGELRDFLEENKSIKLTYEDKEWGIDYDKLKFLIFFKKSNEGVELTLHADNINKLLNSIAKEINIAPTDAVLEFSEDGNRVTKFVPQNNGRTLNIAESINKLNKDLFNFNQAQEDNGSQRYSLVVDEIKPTVVVSDLNELGIKEVIGVGTSDYDGSPSNRSHNIETGRKAFDGVLLAPGEEFSAIGLLGDIDASNGYLEELVIKGNETIPEYGGGLCQVSTTMFRAALDAGVKITERRSHSYNVRYYAPTGTDATIYSPSPDFKFINDTQNYILIHTINDTENAKLIYQFWGTNDGRQVEMTDPVTYDWVSPPPEKLIETTEIPPGTKKCTESAHAGVKAYFDQTITYADGNVNEKRYKSSYRPWQRVCLIGVEKVAEEEVVDENIDQGVNVDEPDVASENSLN